MKGRVADVAAMLLAVQWLPDAGTLVSANGEIRGQAVPGDDVYRALLGVWLGDHPTSTGLKRELLGQTK